ncbi:hypothetical protein L916_12411 [Phytophthora nicotianae]|uniref:Uncharacterized protein n=1 Tax=Phytophthora nicotianae TaxID=4792 RepID=W2IPX7_PHYNI|nr:hypothetical protein L916_12411 [Phytophthora nicotianae]
MQCQERTGWLPIEWICESQTATHVIPFHVHEPGVYSIGQ